MKMVWEENPITCDMKIAVVINIQDIIDCESLTPFDWQFFRECTKSNRISDKLLGLEILSRRIEDSFFKRNNKNASSKGQKI